LIDDTLPPFETPEWQRVGEQLGLRPVRVRDATSISLWSFVSFRQELTDPPAIPTRMSTWYVGHRDGVALLVRPMLLSPTAVFTAVVAEIDPPLFAGLRLYSRELIPYFGALPDLLTGDARFDRRFVVQSFDPPRLGAILRPDPAMTETLLEMTGWGPVIVRDWFVEILASSLEPIPERLDHQLQAGAALATMVSARASALPERTEEAAARESWASYAGQIPLSFDRRRWRMWGSLHGLEVEALLGGSPPSVITTLRVAFARPLDCGLYVRRGFYVGRGFFNRRITPGYPELDSLLVIDAQNVARRKELFADAELRSRIGEQATSASLVITDSAITLTRATLLPAHEIATRLEALVEIAHRLAPAPRRHGPFR
jgi:hypothetical protein